MRHVSVLLLVALAITGCARLAGSRKVPKNHRAAAAACSPTRPAALGPGQDAGAYAANDPSACRSDADCTQGVNGRCLGGRAGYRCSYDACMNDAECKDHAVCQCDDGIGSNSCVTGTCRVDADCGAGGFCSPSQGSCGSYFGVALYACHQAADECTDDEDCNPKNGETCRFEATVGHWKCSSSHCVGAMVQDAPKLACAEEAQ